MMNSRAGPRKWQDVVFTALWYEKSTRLVLCLFCAISRNLKLLGELISTIIYIVGMYHEVDITPNDSDFLQFSWWPNGDIQKHTGLY